MPKYLTQQEAFSKCQQEGKFLILEEVDYARIKTTLTIAKADITSANKIKENLPKQSDQWNSVYKLY